MRRLHGAQPPHFARRFLLILCTATAAAVSACSGEEEGPTRLDLPKGAYFLFGMVGDSTGAEDFVAVTSDSVVVETARQLLRLPAGERQRHAHGFIRAGSGGVNLDWNWHFIPDQWDLVEMSVEVCDGRPSFVHNYLDEWLELGYFCPWGSYIKEELSPADITAVSSKYSSMK